MGSAEFVLCVGAGCEFVTSQHLVGHALSPTGMPSSLAVTLQPHPSHILHLCWWSILTEELFKWNGNA